MNLEDDGERHWITKTLLAPDRTRIAADKRDVAHVAVQIVDAMGVLVPDADNEVTFQVGGAGALLGLDSGDPASHEDYRSPRRKAFHGLCLAIVRSTTAAGSIQVSASSPSLAPAQVSITTERIS